MALDVAWQQVLRLNLQTQDEIDTFHAKTYTWLRGIYSKPGSPELKATLEVREYLVEAIETKIAQLQEAGESDGSTVGGLLFATMEDVDDDGNGVEKNHNQRTLSNEEVIDNALLLILAATETTASNLANALLLMGLHSDVWRRVVDEQNSIVEEHGEAITQDILEQHCPYLDAVVRETLRILPVTLVSRRETSETIVIDGQQIPKGWGISYNIFLTHQRDESLASDTLDSMDLLNFCPSRWLDAETRPNNRDYLPFGAGPRKCPGIVLAKTEMMTFLAVFARNVEYELVADIDKTKPIDEQIAWKQLNAVPMPEDGVRIRVLN